MNRQDLDRFKRLLLIDDEPGIRRMMSLDLTADGFLVTTAEDGASGLAAFERERPDIVLTDIKMPGLDGLEVLRRIKDQSPETEVIVITGHGDMEAAIESLKLEASDFITKPIGDDALALALKRAQDKLRLKAELKAYTQNLEQKVAEATQKLLSAERLAAVGRTVAGLAHAVKNLLGGLRGGAFMIREGFEKNREEILGQGLDMLERNLKLVKDFVQKLLSLSGDRKPEKSLFDAGRLAAEAVEVMTPEARNKGVTLGLRAGTGEILVHAERPAIMDALLNLVSNALDAAALVPEGRVEVMAARLGEEVVLEVADNGPGLDEEAQAQVFQGFYTSKGSAGTGLGLMIVQKNVTENGGRVDFESRQNQGAAFRLLLPLAGQSLAEEWNDFGGKNNQASPRSRG